MSNEGNVSEIFDNFFVNKVPNLKVQNNHNCNMDFDDPVLNAINQNKYQSSIVMINRKIEPERILF